MTENEFILQDRITKIKSVINQYGEENFYISFSGGKDSTVLHYLIDIAIPGNNIPRVYADTGIEYKLVKNFVLSLKENDNRFVILKPDTPIIPMLKKYGYPFKSKEHAAVVESYQKGNTTGLWVKHYLEKTDRYKCPDVLRYQFTDECKLKISDKCCENLKEKPLSNYEKEFNRKIAITGIMRSEQGRRSKAQCLAFKNKKLWHFQPLSIISVDWENWFIKEYNIKLSPIYYPPYNFNRTGCKGCPFNPNLHKSLDTLEKFFPDERKQCEIIWGPVYDEYRRIDYRLKKEGEKHDKD